MIRILFVCTGNTCRSPMAEALLRGGLPEGWEGRVEVSSAGIYAAVPSPATELAVEVMREIGLEIDGHESRQVTPEMIGSADLVVAMTEAHAGHVANMVPGAQERTLVLGSLDEERADPDVRDPIGGGRRIYEETRDELAGLTERLVAFIRERFPEPVD